MTKIHPTAIIEDGAELADAVEVGAYAYVGAGARIGEGTWIAHHATVEGNTVMGKYNQVFPYAYLGGLTHDMKYSGGRAGLKVGDFNVFREYSSANLATNDGDFTVIGSRNTFLSYCQIAHDCVIGSNILASAHSAFSGWVKVGDFAVVGWGSGVQQHCRIGDYAMLSANSKLLKDLPPFFTADGAPAQVCAINKVNMLRNNFSMEEVDAVYSAFKLIYKRGLTRAHAVAELAARNTAAMRPIKMILDFANTKSDRALA